MLYFILKAILVDVIELLELLKIQSVSADLKFKNDVLNAANFLKNNLNEIGAENVEIFPTQGHPIVYAEKIISSDLPTILVYGHYDVQPADPYELWDSDPFSPVIKNTEIQIHNINGFTWYLTLK